MRKKVIFSLVLSFLLVVNFNVLTSKALEYSEVSLDTSDFYLENQSLLELNDDKNLLNENFSIESIEASTIDNVSDSLQVESVGNATMLYGSQSGVLPQAGQYALYPLTLSAGDYLQARLTPPNNSQIDYDLRLYNSSFNLLTQSDYITAMREGHKTIEESIGYYASSNVEVYLCVISVQGGSLNDPYILDIAITTNAKDQFESDEFAAQATTLIFNNYATVNVTRNLNSPLDTDWYEFTVEDSPAYDKMRLYIDNSSTNGAKIQIYQNYSSNPQYFGLLKIGEGNGGELDLAPGHYYLRVINTNSLDSFNINNIGTYKFSIEPVGRVDLIEITSIGGNGAVLVNPYVEGRRYRITETDNTYVQIVGKTYYLDENGVKQTAPNAQVHGTVTNRSWIDMYREDMAYTNGQAASDNTGLFKAYIPVLSGVGSNVYQGERAFQYYDVMDVEITPVNNTSIKGTEIFYLLKRESFFRN
ncbi:MAG: hypothetical protein IKW81_11505 [Pseudobutyrivibrio sp.]|nr:hypothetical protein [Pseudobutyrivibrio sp.]